MFNMTNHDCPNSENLEKHEEGSQFLQCIDCRAYINRCRVIHHIIRNSDGSIDNELHTKRAGESALKFCDKMEMDELYTYLKMMTQFTAMVSYAYAEREVKLRIANPSAARGKSGDEFKKALAAERLSQRPKKEQKHLSDFDKAVAVLTKSGVSLEVAQAAIKEQFAKQGKAYE